MNPARVNGQTQLGESSWRQKMSLAREHLRVQMALHPQWWVWASSAIAWIWLLLSLTDWRFNHIGDLNAAMQDICRVPVRLASTSDWINAVLSGLGGWMLMVVAMMFPLIGEPIASVAFASPWYRRQTAIGIFLLGYLSLWLLIGIVLRIAMIAIAWVLPSKNALLSYLLPVFGFALAAAWVWSPARRKAQLNCSRTIALRISGWQAEWDCLRYGVMMGNACVRTCWPPMVALMLLQHGLGMMVLVAGLLAYERFFLTHKSKFLGYAWGTLAILLLAWR